jgi:PAS domain S-box-containing protein
MISNRATDERLHAEIAELRARLEEAEDTLRAIRSGGVDSLVIETETGPQMFSLEAAAGASNRFRGEILAQVTDAVIAVDREERITFLNAAAERLYGVAATEAVGQPLQWLTPGEVAPAWGTWARGGEWRGETLHVTRDGRTFHVEAQVSVHRLEDGSIAGCIASIRDISERKRAAAELERVSVLLNTLLRAAPIGVCFLDRELRYRHINDRLAAMNGMAAEAHVGRQVSEIVPARGADVRDVTGRILTTGEAVVNQEVSGHTPAAPGVTRFWNESWYPVRDDAGELLGFGGIVEDITARKQAEAQLREREYFLRRLTEVTPSIITVFDLETKRNVFINRTVASALGYTPEEIAAMDAREVPTLMHPDDWARFTAHRDRVRALRDDEVAEFEHRIRDRAGGWHWFHSREAVFARNAAGAVSQLIVTSMDISARKQAEGKLRESEGRFRLSLQHSGILVYTTDADLRYTWIQNPYPGFTAADVIGRRDDELFTPQHAAPLIALKQRVLASGIGDKAEVMIELNGDEHVYSLTVEPMHEAAGPVMGVAVAGMDITERKTSERLLRQAAAALTEADRRKDEFLATLAHELRNPLAPIRTGLALLRLAEDRTPRVDRLATMMERQVGHIVRLVDDLMDVTRVNTGKVQLRRERVSVATVVADAVEAVRPLMQERDHVLTVTVPSAPLVLDIDPVRVSQVISNLLTNAAKFTERQGRIAVTVEQRGDEVVIAVTDTGVGLAPPDVARIFELFTQVDPARGHTQGGLGIGLALSKRLVEMHGGTIRAASAGVGRGSEFSVWLPLSSAAPPALSPPRVDSRIMGKTSRKILVVDDNRDSADTVSTMLQKDGHDTRVAYDGETALEVATAFRPEVALLDIGLPVMNGYEVCRHLRAQAWATGLVVMALTGWASEVDRRRSQDAGFDHHLVKPVDPDALRWLLAAPVAQAGDQGESRTVGSNRE